MSAHIRTLRQSIELDIGELDFGERPGNSIESEIKLCLNKIYRNFNDYQNIIGVLPKVDASVLLAFYASLLRKFSNFTENIYNKENQKEILEKCRLVSAYAQMHWFQQRTPPFQIVVLQHLFREYAEGLGIVDVSHLVSAYVESKRLDVYQRQVSYAYHQFQYCGEFQFPSFLRAVFDSLEQQRRGSEYSDAQRTMIALHMDVVLLGVCKVGIQDNLPQELCGELAELFRARLLTPLRAPNQPVFEREKRSLEDQLRAFLDIDLPQERPRELFGEALNDARMHVDD